jgi:hypothetical protein
MVKGSMSWRKSFKGEDSRFMLSTAYKVVGILLMVSLFVAYELFQFIRMNYLFLKSNGFVGMHELKQAYFDFILADFSNNAIYIFFFFILVFFMGLYMGKMLLRPFKNIGDYCSAVIDHPDKIYHIDQFSDYRLLTRFSDHFFSYMRDARIKKELVPAHVAPEFMGIHKPVLDKLFLFHFSLFLIFVLIVSSWMILYHAFSIHEKVIEISLKIAKRSSTNLQYFIGEQHFVVNELYLYVGLLMIIFYLLLAIHLYSQVSGAAFGIFSTMRSFMKGNHSTRVHLVGYSYVRDYTRQLNKFLDYLQKNFSSDRHGH